MFGKCLYDIANQAKSHALAAQKYAYEYRAPDQCGSGSIRIQLYKTSPIWDPVDSSWSWMLLLGSMQACQRTSKHGALSFRHLVHSRSPSLMEFSRISLSEDPSNYKAFAENTRKDRKLSDVLGQEKLQVLAQSLDYQPLCAINTFMRSGHWRLGRILCLLL